MTVHVLCSEKGAGGGSVFKKRLRPGAPAQSPERFSSAIPGGFLETREPLPRHASAIYEQHLHDHLADSRSLRNN